MTELLSKKIYCIIPAFNEAGVIAKVIEGVKPFVTQVVVIDDCSSDNTSEEARKTGVKVLRHVINRGQGAALQTGNEYALKYGADIIVHFDADGQFMASDIKEAVLLIANDEAEVVLGSRFLGKESNMPWTKRYLIMPIARLVNKILFQSNLSDPQNGFRVLSRVAAEKIIINNDGSAHCNEILHKIFHYKLRVKEIPITVVYNEFGQTLFGGKGRGKGGFRIIKDLFLSFLID